MLPKDKKLLRLASARLDVSYSLEAYGMLKSLDPASSPYYHMAVSMAVSYGRPFTANNGLGSLFVEYPQFPDFEDPELNLRHQRLIDLRHKFMAHSSCEGTRVLILPPGSKNPLTGELVDRHDHLVGKRSFGDVRFYDWLKDVVIALKQRLDEDCRKRLAEIGVGMATADEMETGYDDFKWSTPKNAQQGARANDHGCHDPCSEQHGSRQPRSWLILNVGQKTCSPKLTHMM
jgi:hypothetical protein